MKINITKDWSMKMAELEGDQEIGAGSLYKGVKHPEIKVKLSGQDGNAFVIMGLVSRKLPFEERESFREECMQGDYDHLLRICMRWVTVI